MQTNKKQDIDSKIYKEFLNIKNKKSKLTVIELAKKFNISRQRIYQIVQDMEKGKDEQLDKCLMNGRLACLWDHRYKPRFDVVVKMKRTPEGKEIIKIIVLDMMLDGFSMLSISKFTKLDRGFLTKIVKK